MTDALVNNKPQFVRLFTENGLNILDYLTYGRLESLYRSTADGTLAYQLLQRRLVERQGNSGSAHSVANLLDSSAKVTAGSTVSGPAKELSLFEVSREGCKAFYNVVSRPCYTTHTVYGKKLGVP